jgi:hypothetical protein
MHLVQFHVSVESEYIVCKVGEQCLGLQSLSERSVALHRNEIHTYVHWKMFDFDCNTTDMNDEQL